MASESAPGFAWITLCCCTVENYVPPEILQAAVRTEPTGQTDRVHHGCQRIDAGCLTAETPCGTQLCAQSSVTDAVADGGFVGGR